MKKYRSILKTKAVHWAVPSSKFSNEYKTVLVSACGWRSGKSNQNIEHVDCGTCIKIYNKPAIK